jgi:hypothetical protein
VSDASFRKLTGFMFILTPLWLFANSRVLGSVSGFPDIQFKGIDALLTRVAQSGTAGVLAWYVYIVPGVLYIASIVLFQKLIEKESESRPWFPVATTLGVCAWAIQFFGLVRWIFVYPYLARLWLNAPDEATRAAVRVTFDVFNNYAGFALGQTIGIGLTAVWILLLGVAIRTSPMFKPWLGWVGIVVAVGELIGNLGPLGSVIPSIDLQTFFNISGFFWYVSYAWMAYLGVVMLRAKSEG